MLIQDQIQSQKQKIDPKIIMANNLLQLSGLELQQEIEHELAENPALELEDDEPCSGCELAPFACKNCQHGKQAEEDSVSISDAARADEYPTEPIYDAEEEEDLISRVRAEITLHEHLRSQLRNIASDQLYDIGEYLINYIDESGYLKCNLTELPLELDYPDEEIARAVSLIHTLDPPGVGARDLQECLLIQLRYLSEDGHGNSLAETIIEECWPEVAGQKVNRIAYRLKAKHDAVRQALQFIKTELNPYPAAGFRQPWDHNPSEGRNSVRPDVIIHRTSTGYEIEVVANEKLSLTINPQYSAIYNILKGKRSGSDSGTDRKHIIESVARAEFFIKNLNQRRKTLRSITKCIVEHQHGYLSTGSKLFLRPLTRVKVGEELGIHESTVSRATSDKYILLPSQELVAFDFFFQTSETLKDMVATLMNSEDPTKPRSDQDIADILAQQGYTISRRTVAKYRKSQKILSSRHRGR